MNQKPILVPTRLRRPPKSGWSWVDRRFVREHMAHLSRDAVLLYFFLCAVADKHGVSFYGDGTLIIQLGMSLAALIDARRELLTRDLIAHEIRGTQVLSLQPCGQHRRHEPSQGLMALGDILHKPSHRASEPGRGLTLKVAVWAEIRRLAEIEKLSGRAISRQLGCSRESVAAALKLDRPPTREVVQRRSLLDAHRSKIDI